MINNKFTGGGGERNKNLKFLINSFVCKILPMESDQPSTSIEGIVRPNWAPAESSVPAV